MTSFDLKFGCVNILQEDIAEVVINEGVELDHQMVDVYHTFLLKHLNPPFSLLVNKHYAYSYTFDAQKKLATLPQINAIAVVVYNQKTYAATDSVIDFPREVDWKVQIFKERQTALSWLQQEQNQL